MATPIRIRIALFGDNYFRILVTPKVQDAYWVHPTYSVLQGHDLVDRAKSSPEQIKMTASICKHILCDDGSAACSCKGA